LIRGTPLLAALFVALLAVPLRADLPEPPPPEADEVFARAAEALDRGDAESARKDFDDLLARFPLPAWQSRVELFRARRKVAGETGPPHAQGVVLQR